MDNSVPSAPTDTPTYTKGDFVLVSGNNLTNKLIQFGQGFRFDKKYALYDHAAIIINEQGDIIEATPKGIKLTNISKYSYSDYKVKIVHIEANDEDREEAVNFAKSRLCEGYSWIDIVSIGLSLLTGCKLAVGIDGEELCSGLVCRALERTKFIPQRDASHTCPAELAKLFNVA